MATYVSLIHFTEQGIRTIKEDVHRESIGALIGKHEGVKIVGEWWTMGEYDAVMVTEAPDDETMTRFLLGAGRQGNIRTTTMRAFSAQDMQKIVSKLA